MARAMGWQEVWQGASSLGGLHAKYFLAIYSMEMEGC